MKTIRLVWKSSKYVFIHPFSKWKSAPPPCPESARGTPKNDVVSDTKLPPLTPPPSYYYNNRATAKIKFVSHSSPRSCSPPPRRPTLCRPSSPSNCTGATPCHPCHHRRHLTHRRPRMGCSTAGGAGFW
jgi:hypothetical protein